MLEMADQDLLRRDFYVYVLFRHDTGQPFYVGKGRGDRWTRHALERPRDTNRQKRGIIKLALEAGADIPRVKLATGLDETAAFQLERLLIRIIGRRSVGGPLVNLTDGGDGEHGRSHTPETKAKMRAAKLGRKLTAEHRQKISDSLNKSEVKSLRAINLKARFRSPEARAKMGQVHLGRKWSAEVLIRRQLNNPGHTGHVHTDEARRKMSLALRGKPWTERQRAARLLAKTQKSPE